MIAQSTKIQASDNNSTLGNNPAMNKAKRSWKKNILRLGCWNVTSFNRKDQEIIIELENHNIDICAISETKIKGKGNKRIGEYIFIYCGKNMEERASSGVGFLIQEKFENHIIDISYINDRILHVKLQLENSQTLNLISVYAPDISKANDVTDQFYRNLQKTIDTISSRDNIVILGDLNARIGNAAVAGVTSIQNDDTINENGDKLIHFCTQNELRINNTFFQHKPQHKYTFCNSRGQRSVIDLVITNRAVHPSKVLDVRVLSSANTGTDHNLVIAKMRLKFDQKKKRKPQNLSEKFNIESFINTSVKELYERRLKIHIKNRPIEDSHDTDTAWNRIQTNILKAAEEALGKRKVGTNSKTKNNKPWYCEEVKDLTNEKRNDYLKYRRGEITYNAYKETRNKINSLIAKIKENFWESFTANMEHDLYGSQKKVWNMLRSRKKPINELINITTIPIDTWVSYFTELLAQDNKAFTTPMLPETIPADTQPYPGPTQYEIESIIIKLKNRKSSGTDEIANEMIKYGGSYLVAELHKLFTKVVKHQKIPAQWKLSITIPVFKKGDKKKPENYRGISLLGSVSKLFTKIIATEISKKGISEEQQGFRRNRSTIDAIFIVRQIVEKAIEFNKPVYMCFVDLTKAFDRVKLCDVIKLLRKKNVPENIVALVQDLNTDNKTIIRANGIKSDPIPITTGIRQGDSLSPILFNVVMDAIIEKVREAAPGYRLGSKNIKIVCYADDAVILSETEDNLQRLLFEFEKAAGKFNMEISAEKTKSMAISREPLRCKLAVYNRPIEQVLEFNYLGTLITSNKDIKKESKIQVTKAAAISGGLKDIIWRNKYMRIKSKTRIYKTCVRPILTYASETRADTTATQHHATTVEMHILRAIAGHTLYDRKTNPEIREVCEIEDINKFTRKRRKEWRNHVERMNSDRIAKVVMKAKPNVIRPQGRPPRRWNECWTSSSQDDFT